MNNCSVFNGDKTKCESLVLASRISGAVSLVVSILVLVLLLVYKYYRLFEERIILNTQISVLLTSIVFVSQSGFKNKGLCSFLGILTTYVGWSLSLWALMMILNFILSISGSTLHEKFRKKHWLTYLVGWGLPVIPALLPLSTLDYGLAGFSCWLTSIGWQWGDYHAWLMTMILCMLGMYIYIVYKLVQVFHVYRGTGLSEIAAEQKRRVRERIIVIAAYPLAFLSLSTVPFINRLYNIFHPPNYQIFMAHAVISPLRGVIFSFIFAIDLIYSKRLSVSQFKSDVRNLCLASNNREDVSSTYLPETSPTVLMTTGDESHDSLG